MLDSNAARSLTRLALFAPSLACGCASEPWSRERAREREVFGYSVEGRPIDGLVFGEGRQTLLFLGVTHGDEPAGAALLEGFAAYVATNPRIYRTRRIVIVPVVNPDGLERGTRRNARDIDINRNFPSRNWTGAAANRSGSRPASEPETKTVLRLVRQFAPVRILSVHSPLRMVNYDGPARQVAEAVAANCGYPVADSVGYPTPGSLGSYAGIDWGIPTITLELDRDVGAAEAWRDFKDALLAFVAHENASVARGDE